MRKIMITIGAVWLLAMAPLSATAQSVDSEYKDYQSSSRTQSYFGVAFDRDRVTIHLFEGTEAVSVTGDRNAVLPEDGVASLTDSVFFAADGLHFNGKLLPYDQITDSRVFNSDDLVMITFLTLKGDTDRLGRIRRGNRLSFDRKITINEDEFVRGMVLSILGDIDVYGEVNKDVISLFGQVYVGPAAVARGDVASLTGKIDAAQDASVYGELYSGTDFFTKRSHRFFREAKTGTFTGSFNYNRVDGATPTLRAGFNDADSLLPSAWIEAGYAFASSRWRLELGIEQPLMRRLPLSVGGAYYRRLASEDDWLLNDDENVVFTLLVTEDFKDYREGEGGTFWTTFKPLANVTFEGRYRYEETNWRRAHRNLWSLFGGDKKFPRNFHSVEDPYRSFGVDEIDTTANGALSASLDWDTRTESEPFLHSAWHATGELEWSHPDLSSDFDYRRYTISLRRYQQVHRRAMVLVRLMYGGSDGYLPMYKRFFLGGLGSLHGYKHKELMGSKFWMANLEYRIEFPRTDLGASLLYDVGQIANDHPLDSDIEVKHSLGVGFWIGDDVRINLAKRLDRSYDDTPRLWVRFDHVF